MSPRQTLASSPSRAEALVIRDVVGFRQELSDRPTVDDEPQMDIVEVMEIRDGLIQHHRVYWGWFSVNMLKGGQHPG